MKIISSFLTLSIFVLFSSCNHKASDDKNNIYPPEMKEIIDRKTGVPIRQLTNYKGNSHHFYFTNPAWYDNGQKLLFSSDRNNRTNLFSVDLNNYTIEQLTDLELVSLPYEVEFIHAFKNPVKDEVFYWHELKLISLDLNSLQSSTIYKMDQGWKHSLGSCSADGKYAYFSIMEDLSHLFEVDLLRGYIGQGETWKAKPHCKIVKVATDGSSFEVVFEEKNWINHVNTSTTQSNIITFCHEGPWKKVDNRIWGLNVETKEVWKIRPKNHEGERVGHEYWYEDGETIGLSWHPKRWKRISGTYPV